MKNIRKTDRRRALGKIAATLVAPWIVSSESRAQAAWPVKPVRYINPYPAGGPTDTLSRLFCAQLTEITGQQFVVENRGGDGGDIGVEMVARSEPDGYTVGLGGIASNAIAPTLKAGKMRFDAAKDFTFVSTMWSLPNFLVAHLSVPANTVPELLDLLRKNPKKYFYGHSGAGTTPHLSGVLFNLLGNVELVHVPYKGTAPAMTDLLGGQVQFVFDNIPGALAQYRPGKVKGFAVTSAARSAAVPDIPSLGEFLPGYDLSSWTALLGPARIPPAVVERMSMFAKQALESADLKQKYLDRGATAWWSSPQDVTAYRASEEKRLGDIIRKANIKIE
ncbi:MAG TPA: tripartite tricarboxylate transporter substrate binding protein [Burkholderiales bacterium]|jgi:tripartite-type tricarboxylate transporter receptor subunit TctC|nr:tripartite tricarboxylate transporter substrate binding protein [Burkholderiales bacterium]